ncbi:hypothetical protein B0H12DRAFT_1073346 [Mycena haematopus]|nr:hypothetical protein B0H12DRAFT_1073346 [Mycena haematopus]
MPQIGPKWPWMDSLGVRTLSSTSRSGPGLRIGIHGKIAYHIKYKLQVSADLWEVSALPATKAPKIKETLTMSGDYSALGRIIENGFPAEPDADTDGKHRRVIAAVERNKDSKKKPELNYAPLYQSQPTYFAWNVLRSLPPLTKAILRFH